MQVRKYTGDHWKLADGDKKQVAFTVKSKNDAHVSYLDVPDGLLLPTLWINNQTSVKNRIEMAWAIIPLSR